MTSAPSPSAARGRRPLESTIDDLVSERADHVEALVVLRQGHPILERSYTGTTDQLRNVKSVTKSVLAALVGIAVDMGLVPTLELTWADVLPERVTRASADRTDITLRHLLQMRSGLQWVENGPITAAWLRSPDMIEFTLERQEVAAPAGRAWNYSTADSHLLAFCLARLVGMPLEEFARERLFDPLGIRKWHWGCGADGIVIGGSELNLTPHDMAGFGRLMQTGGTTENGRRIVSSAWIDDMRCWQPDVDAATIEAVSDALGLAWPDELPRHRLGYGYQWWHVDIAGHDCWAALGFGGQLVAIHDASETVVAQVCSLDRAFPPSEIPYRINAALQVAGRALEYGIGTIRPADGQTDDQRASTNQADW